MAECNFLQSWQRSGIKWRSLPGWLEGIASQGDKWLAVISDRIWFLQADGQSASRSGRLWPTALSQVTPWEETRAYSFEMKSPAVVNPPPLSTFRTPPGQNLICSARGRLRLCLIGDVLPLTIEPAVAQWCRCFVAAFYYDDAFTTISD